MKEEQGRKERKERKGKEYMHPNSQGCSCLGWEKGIVYFNVRTVAPLLSLLNASKNVRLDRYVE